jgi:hypothetical protein
MARAQAERDLAAWRASLVGGVVVAGAVWGLLEALRRAAVDVDESVEVLWTAGKRLAQNTQTAHLLDGTRDGGVALLEELGRHRDLMGDTPP